MLADSPDPTRIFIWSLALIGAIVVMFAAVSLLRRKLSQPDASPAAGFTLADLRQLHQRGQLTTEEFERAKAKLLSGLKDQKPPKPQ